MSFAFRKLYPGAQDLTKPPPVNCCGVECGCIIQTGGDVSVLQDEICICPAATEVIENPLNPCTGDPPECSICTFTINRCQFPSNWWNSPGCVYGGGVSLDCLSNDAIPCICGISIRQGSYPVCIEPDQNPCCPTPPVCVTIPDEYEVGGGGGVYPLLDECLLVGAVPHTYRVENVGFAPFPCGISNSPQYPNYFLIENNSLATLTGSIGDPDFAKSTNPNGWPLIRYHKVPSQGSPIDTSYMVDFSRYCLKLHNTISQDANSGNRAMVFSGRNVYRYSGVLSGDPRIPLADPLWDDPGASGLSQLEGFLGRSFPLADSYLTLPLWGETASDNMGLGSGVGDSCDDTGVRKPYIDCCDNAPSGEPEKCDVCIGCNCISSDPHGVPATGHYLPSNQGYTAGYFSFSCFNPYAYLDCLYVAGDNTGAIVPAGYENQLGFGWTVDMVQGDGYGCDDAGSNCVGFKGATAHGPRLGFPTCSVWSLIKSVYARVLKAATTNGVVNAFDGGLETKDEAWFRGQFPNFSSAVSDALQDDPGGTKNGTSNVQYHLAKIANTLYVDSQSFLSLYTANPTVFSFTFPNVFLWDKDAYIGASTNEQRWQNLFIVGNANVLFDSTSAAIKSPAYSGNETDAQDYRSFVFTLDEVTHNKTETVTEATNHARLVIFNGSHGPVGTGDPSNTTNPSARVNATSKISLTELPFCAGITSSRYPDLEGGNTPITLCEICNAWPNAVCLTGSDPACAPVNGLDATGNVCMYPGGWAAEPNCMTANYEIPGADLPVTTLNFVTSTVTQPFAIYVDPSIMLGFVNDPWVVNEADVDDPTGSLRKPYVDRLEAVSKYYKYMQQDVGSKVNPPPGADRTEGFTGFKEFYARLSSDQKKTVMIEQEFPWLSILSATSGQAIDNNSVDWFTNTKYQRLLSDEFERQRALGVSYLDGGLTPQSPGTTLSTLKSVTKRLWGDCAQYAKDNGSENVIFFNTQGASIAATQVGGIVPWEGIRYNNTTDGRSWWRGTSSVLSYEDRYAQGMPGGSRDNFLDLAEANASGDANVVQIYNFFPNMGGPTAVNAWNSVIQRLDDNGMGGSAAQSYDFDLDDLNYWTKMTIGSTFYRYRDVLNTLSQTYATVDPNKPVALITQPASPPLKDGGGGDDAGWISNNRWSFMKDPQLYAEYEIGGSFLFEGDGNVPNVSYPDQIWMWTAGPYYNVTLPMLRGTGSNGAEEMEILGARCQLEKLLFKRPEMQTVAEGGLSSEAELVSDAPITSNSALIERRRAWLRANTLPNVYWDARRFIDANGNGVFDSGDTWYSEGITSNVRYWSALTGNCLPSPCVFDRTSELAPWLNFNNDIYKNDVRVAYKHWVSERHVSAVEAAYKTITGLGLSPLVN